MGGYGKFSNLKLSKMKKSEYKRLTTHESVLNRIDMYLGYPKKIKRKVFVFDETGIHETKLKAPVALIQTFKEAIQNVADAIIKGRKKGLSVDKPIEIEVTEKIVKMKNYGATIPTDIIYDRVDKKNVPLPTMLFTQLHAGSNFGDVNLDNEEEIDNNYENDGGGKHGIGISAVTILSKEFKIDLGDPDNNRRFRQTFTDNAQTSSEPEITEYTGEPYVQIEYELEFDRFDNYLWDELAINHLKWMTINMSFTLNLDFIFNGESVYVEDDEEEGDRFIRFGKLYFPVKDNDHILVFHNKHCSVIIADTLNEGKQISFANTLYLQNNGPHMDKVVESVGRKFLDQMKDKYVEKFGTSNPESVETKSAKRSAASIFKINRFTENVSFIVIVNMPNPRFGGGQIKENLQDFPYEIEVPEEIFRKMENWSFMEVLNDIIENKVTDALKASDGRRNARRPNLGNTVTHANWAGIPDKKQETILFLNEGNSAKQASDVIASLLDNGTNLIGSLPLRGKILNVRKNKKPKRELKNKEIFEIKQMLGLQEGDSDPKLLRYGYCCLLFDADVDGGHCSSLLLNFFHFRYPKLIKKGFVLIKWTPQMVAKKGKQFKFFYTEADFNEWKNRKGWTTLYKKGLGSLKKEELVFDMKDPKYSIFRMDSLATQSINKFFHNSFADERKEAILKYIPKSIKIKEGINLSDYLNNYLLEYSVEALKRCLPRFEDNLKPSQRKVVWTVIKNWKYSKGKNLKTKSVSSLSGLLKDLTEYHHGETSSQEAIIAMAQNFPCSNNINLLSPEGLFGSRKAGGSDHSSARYLETRPSIVFPYVFREEDHKLLKLLDDRGKEIEPEFMLPTIPMHLINGSEGIGTGWSTSIPAHLPEDVLRCLRELLEDESLSDLMPGCVGFKGEIEVKEYHPRHKRNYEDEEEPRITIKKKPEIKENKEERDNIEKIEKDEEIEEEPEEIKEGEELDPALKKLRDADEVLIDENTKNVVVSRGIFSKIDGNKVLVTELPVGRWSQSYIARLERMIKSKKIKDYESHSVDNIIKFIIKGLNVKATYKNLSLEKVVSMSNMILLGEGYKPKKYETSEEILREFYKFRLPWYQKRKEYLLEEMLKRIDFCRQRVKLLQLIIDKKIKINNRSRKDVAEQIIKFDIDVKIMDGLSLWSITKDDIQKYVDEKEKLEAEHEELNKKTPQKLWLDDLVDLEKALIKMKIIPKNKASRYIEDIDEKDDSDDEEEDEEGKEKEENGDEKAPKPKGKGKKKSNGTGSGRRGRPRKNKE